MQEIHAEQVIFDDRRTLKEVIELIKADLASMKEAKSTEETVSE